jgi:ComF family protein
MTIAGKLFKHAAAAIARQPWIEMLFPANCISCGVELPNERQTSSVTIVEEPGLSINPDDFGLRDCESGFQDWQASNWCRNCWMQIESRTSYRCFKCGAGLSRPTPVAGRCGNCVRTSFKFDQALAVGNYQGLLRELVIRMKNQHDDVLAIQLGNRLAYKLIGQGWTKFDQLVPVPLHWSRRLRRGFQATEILCDRISRLTGIRKSTNTVLISRATAKQGTLSSTARIANVRHAFAVRPNAIKPGARILVVDDVMTTGATTSEIARVLKAGGAEYVGVAVVARGGVG